MIRKFKLVVVLTAALMLCASGLWAQVSEHGAATPYVVQKGDTASGIAKKHYGKASLGKALWQANKHLVAHPKRLTVGDTIYLFPEATLRSGAASLVPPPPMNEPTNLYDRGELLSIAFPKYFTFVADGRGLGEAGSVRIKVKKTVTDKETEVTRDVEELFEVRHVGDILASDHHPGIQNYTHGGDKARYAGRTLLSTNDEVTVQFTEDVAKILDSDTYGDSDPYYREFPIYGKSHSVRVSNKEKSNRAQNLGEMYKYKGVLTVVARVEGTTAVTPRVSKNLKKRGGTKKAQGVEPVTYVARITHAVDGVELDDHVFLFVPLSPGPERLLQPPYVEPADSYVSVGY